LDITGIDSFQGDNLMHSSQYEGAKKLDGQKKKNAIVVGSSNSGHEVAQDYSENGWDVTMVQRDGTYRMSSDAGLDVLISGLYDKDGVSSPLRTRENLLADLPNLATS
jgi:cation diffusion facilitator CzcD-associated flavoprotein CzcO